MKILKKCDLRSGTMARSDDKNKVWTSINIEFGENYFEGSHNPIWFLSDRNWPNLNFTSGKITFGTKNGNEIKLTETLGLFGFHCF